jgi:hypothetical protein
MTTLRTFGFLLLLSASAALAETPLKELPLPAAKASILIPDGWHVKEDNEEGVIVYLVTREKITETGGTYSVGLTLSVTPDVPGRAQMSPSKYAAELLAFSVEDGGVVQESRSAPFHTLRTEYAVEGEAGHLRIVDVATANDTTGTLYFFAWQAPDMEAEALSELREKIIASMKFDPAL